MVVAAPPAAKAADPAPAVATVSTPEVGTLLLFGIGNMMIIAKIQKNNDKADLDGQSTNLRLGRRWRQG